MTVINPSSISGITSITMPSGDGNVLTIHTNDGTERFRIDSSGNVKVGSACTISQDGDVFFTGVTTATTYAGSGANLTNLPAANVTGTLPAISGANLTNLTAGNLTGALPAISGANLTGIAATDNVRTGILDVAGIATFRDTVNIPNLNSGQLAGRRNIMINGAMVVAQRGTSSTSDGYLVDRFKLRAAGTDEWAFTQSQEDVAVSEAPYYTDGHRKYYDIQTTTVETSNIGSDEYVDIFQRIEANNTFHLGYGQSGGTAKTLTLSFWVRAYQTGTYVFYLYLSGGKMQTKTYTISASNTWEKKTIVIEPDGADAQALGSGYSLQCGWMLAAGSNFTSGSNSTSYITYASGNFGAGQTTDITSSTNNFFHLTGVQLEVGSQATAFEHHSFGEELALCRRYYRVFQDGSGGGCDMGAVSYNYDVNSVVTLVHFSPEMRATPTLDNTSGTNYYRFYRNSGYVDINALNAINGMTKYGGGFNNSDSGNGTAGQTGGISLNNTSAKIAFDAEL